jgi:hypothetical protein
MQVDRMPFRIAWCLFWLILVLADVASGQSNLPDTSNAGTDGQTAASTCRILAHYMPWYSAKPFRDQWGWHWTMNHFDPDQITDGQRDIAAPFYPLIGPYDSADPDVLEYHLLLMKLAGIDGVIVDWYGREDFRDYEMLHRNTEHLVNQIRRLKMKFLICYEDQTIPALVEGQRLQANQRIDHAVGDLRWLAANWFPLESYLKLEEKPVLLSFGYSGLTNEQWQQCLEQFSTPIVYLSEHDRRPAASGAFDWPIPKDGLHQTQRFAKMQKAWEHAVPVAFPRFHDIYATAGIGEGYARIADRNGKTLEETLQLAIAQARPIIQIATWNDWGEGTQIEPSREFGYRDLEHIQQVRQATFPTRIQSQANDLRIPLRLLRLRRDRQVDAGQVDQVVRLIVENRLHEARSLLDSLARR